MKNPQQKPDIFSYLDFRKYLADFLAFMRSRDDDFTFQKLADTYQLRSRSHYLDIINGRTLSKKFLPVYRRICCLNEREAEYFDALVSYNQSADTEDKKKRFQTVSNLSGNLNTVKLEKEVYEYFDRWFYPAILSLLDRDKKTRDHRIIARRLTPRISAVQARCALKKLQTLGFLSWDDTRGEWIFHHKFFQCTDSARAAALRDFHRQMLELGTRAFADNSDTQKISTLTVSVSTGTRNEILDMIADLRKRILEKVKSDTCPEMVLQANFHSFLLSDIAPRQSEEGSDDA